MRSIRGPIRSKSGQALVEFAMVLPLLFVLFFGVFEFGIFFYTKLSIRHVVREASRFAITGDSASVVDPNTGQPMSRAQQIQNKILTGAPAVHLTSSNITMTPADGGGPGQVVRLEVNYTYNAKLPPFRLLFPNGRLLIKVSTVTKNENYK